MSFLKVLCLVLLLCGLAAAQATVIGGTASNWAPAYGVYAAPFVPLVTTPSVTLSTVSPAAAGASNATFGNVAGATNATLSDEFVGPAPVGVYSQPVWYGPSAGPEIAAAPTAERGPAHAMHAFDFAVAAQGMGAAQLMASAGPARKASRTYTNQDVDRINQTTGTVKYGGKTEHL